MCGKKTTISDEHEQQQQENNSESSTVVVAQIDGTRYIFDTADCAMMFKRFSSVYGSNFADE
jgi:hypothetical protein